MDADPSVVTSSAGWRSRLWPLLGWLAAGCVVTLALTLAAVHTPPRAKLIGLFYMGFGLAIGFSISKLAQLLDAHPSRRTLAVVAAVLTLAGLIGITAETARLEFQKRSQTATNAIAMRLIEGMKAPETPGDPTAHNSSPLAEFQRHLVRRVRQLGNLTSPWPELLWLSELAAGTTASVLIARRSRTLRSLEGS